MPRNPIKRQRPSWKHIRRLARVYLERSFGALINIIDDEAAPPKARLKAALTIIAIAKPQSKPQPFKEFKMEDYARHILRLSGDPPDLFSVQSRNSFILRPPK